MMSTTAHADASLVAALHRAARTASRFAPSVLNTQPWHWRVHSDRLDLFADHSRQLGASDPDGRLLMLSCGAVLDHAGVALAEQGWRSHVTTLPDETAPDLLATVRLTDRVMVTPQDLRRGQAMRTRHTDRRPLSSRHLPVAALSAIVAAVRDRIYVQVLSADQVLDLATAAMRAADAQAADPAVCTELDRWTGRSAADGAGLPASVLPAMPLRATVPGRDFHRAGTLPMGPGHDRAATYALLYGEADGPEEWIRAGEALSAAWLTATELGVALVPLSDVVAVPGTRQSLRRLLSYLGHPYLVLRLGIADPEVGAPRRTPRLPAAQVVDMTPAPAPDGHRRPDTATDRRSATTPTPNTAPAVRDLEQGAP